MSIPVICVALLAAIASNLLAHTASMLAQPSSAPWTWTWTWTPPLTFDGNVDV